MSRSQFQALVYLTPKISKEVYGSEIEITDRVLSTGLGTFGQSADSQDYGIGVFAFGDLQLQCRNDDGFFNTETDPRSIFVYSRDLAKVRVVFRIAEVTRDANGTVIDSDLTDEVVYRGVISDAATRQDGTKNTVTFKVLTRDSVLSTEKVPPGLIYNGMSTTDALKRILSRKPVTSVLTFDSDEIDPYDSFEIDKGEGFDNMTIVEAIRHLMFATNSVFYVNDDDTMIVKPRDMQTGSGLAAWGPNEFVNTSNIISLTRGNDGRQRLFTSVKINDTVRENRAFKQVFGFRQTSIDLPWIGSTVQAGKIAAAVVEEFKILREEFTLRLPLYYARNVRILQRVVMNYRWRRIPFDGDPRSLPICGDAVCGDTAIFLPRIIGNYRFNNAACYKVIAFEHNLNTMETELKIRLNGRELGSEFIGE